MSGRKGVALVDQPTDFVLIIDAGSTGSEACARFERLRLPYPTQQLTDILRGTHPGGTRTLTTTTTSDYP